jgi:hypothetical protein
VTKIKEDSQRKRKLNMNQGDDRKPMTEAKGDLLI